MCPDIGKIEPGKDHEATPYRHKVEMSGKSATLPQKPSAPKDAVVTFYKLWF